MKEVTILENDRTCLIADVSTLLAENNINIDYISAQSIADKAAIHLVTSDEKRTVEALKKAGFNVLSSDTLVIKLEDKIGELAKVTRKLAENKINIEYLQVLKQEKGKALVSIKTNSTKKAEELLKKYL
ncbi:hypothetical protein HY992_02730 [Candidatus Micrarchaeota archaeon]|nr:hypothetical protein [Candidatus Micrarchaeota archaeon]